MGLKYKHSILLVDDEEAITKSLQRLLRKEKCRIHTASSGNEGLTFLKETDKPVSLIISDQRMPGMSGAQFLEAAKEISPNTIRFLLTGYSDMDAIIDAVNQGEIHRYFTKPWDDNDLVLQVRQALEQYELRFENRRLTALTKRQNIKLKDLNRNLEEKVEERSREIMLKNKELTRLNADLEANLNNTVRAFGSLTELQSPLLAGHARRVSRLAQETAKFLELADHEVDHIDIAALLHDTGILGLPKRLHKFDDKSWSDEDKALFQKHPEEGQAIVRFIKRLDHVGLLIRSHHERFDGSGYPDRLSGEIIPLGSMIIAVADAYDKIINLKANANELIKEMMKKSELTRDHLSKADALQQAAIFHLNQRAGTWYDPEVVEAVLAVIKNRGYRFLEEKVVYADQLKPGMILTRSLYTEGGRFLLPYDTVMTEDYISKLKEIFIDEEIATKIHVTER